MTRGYAWRGGCSFGSPMKALALDELDRVQGGNGDGNASHELRDCEIAQLLQTDNPRFKGMVFNGVCLTRQPPPQARTIKV